MEPPGRHHVKRKLKSERIINSFQFVAEEKKEKVPFCIAFHLSWGEALRKIAGARRFSWGFFLFDCVLPTVNSPVFYWRPSDIDWSVRRKDFPPEGLRAFDPFVGSRPGTWCKIQSDQRQSLVTWTTCWHWKIDKAAYTSDKEKRNCAFAVLVFIIFLPEYQNNKSLKTI